ncbi:MAG TPA: hypothetical protein VE959_19470 [Bryobacteraceae bacterium]|nr:hypothetical protein [Bryobacteraceae bacterium]
MTPVSKRGEIRLCKILATTILLLASTALFAAETGYRSRVDAVRHIRGLVAFWDFVKPAASSRCFFARIATVCWRPDATIGGHRFRTSPALSSGVPVKEVWRGFQTQFPGGRDHGSIGDPHFWCKRPNPPRPCRRGRTRQPSREHGERERRH